MRRLCFLLAVLSARAAHADAPLAPAFSIQRESGLISRVAISDTGKWVAFVVAPSADRPADTVEIRRAGAESAPVVLETSSLPARLPEGMPPAPAGMKPAVVALAFLPDQRLIIVSANPIVAALSDDLDAWTVVDPSTGQRTELEGPRGRPIVCDKRLVEWRRTRSRGAVEDVTWELDPKDLSRRSPRTLTTDGDGRITAPASLAGLYPLGLHGCFRTLVAADATMLDDGKKHVLAFLGPTGKPVKRTFAGEEADRVSRGLLSLRDGGFALGHLDGYAMFAKPPIHRIDASGRATAVDFGLGKASKAALSERFYSVSLGPPVGGRTILLAQGFGFRLPAPLPTELWVLDGGRARRIGQLASGAERFPLASGRTHVALVSGPGRIDVYALPK